MAILCPNQHLLVMQCNIYYTKFLSHMKVQDNGSYHFFFGAFDFLCQFLVIIFFLNYLYCL